MILREAEASVWSVVALCESHLVTLEALLMAWPLRLWEVLFVIPQEVLPQLKASDLRGCHGNSSIL